MKISVINGSPKGQQSITRRHITYMVQTNPDHIVEIIDVGNRMGQIERDETVFNEIIDKMENSDAVVWSFPVYYALIPSQLKRFIELIFERCPPEMFTGKYSTSFSTSINFFDHTAHNYMHGVCEDMGFAYVKSYSANMNDFFHRQERDKMVKFYNWFLEMVSNRITVAKKFYRIDDPLLVYTPQLNDQPSVESSQNVLLLTDETDKDTNLSKMVDTFQKACALPVTVRNIHDIDLKRACAGCCTCGYDNTCSQKDGFPQFYDENVKTADIIIIAGSIKDHFLSSTWKRFIDRSFYNGHIPTLQGKRMGYIVSGPLRQRQNMREVLEALAEVWHLKSVGFVTDEYPTSSEITDHIQGFTKELELSIGQELEFGTRFYEVGGRKLFRDFVYLSSAVFKADNRFYRKTGFYKDFPQKKIKKRLMNAIFSFLLSVKPIRKQIHKEFIPGMVAPYQKMLDKL